MSQQATIVGGVAGVGLLLGALILLGIMFNPNGGGNNSNEPLVKTDCGEIRGTYEEDLGFSFKVSFKFTFKNVS